MFKKATSRQLLSVASLFILVWHAAIGQEYWNGQIYSPVELPVRKIEKVKDSNVLGKTDGQVLIYDVHTKNLRYPEKLSYPQIQSTEYFAGVQGSNPSQSFDSPLEKSFSHLQPVDDALLSPWQQQVKIFVTAANNQRFTCSGTLIDATHVLTAGHCVYSKRKGGWVQEIEVVPAYQDGKAPFGSAKMEEIFSWSEWINKQNYNFDLAVIKIDQPLGAITGWLAYGYESYILFYKKNEFNNPGYPATAPYNGKQLYNWRGNFDFNYGEHLLYVKNKAHAGQSGSGAFHFTSNSEPTVMTVLSHGTSGTNPYTGQVRINKQKFDEIFSYLKKNKSQKLDLQPLFLKTSTDQYFSDKNFNSFSFVLYNHSIKNYQGNLKVALDLMNGDEVNTLGIKELSNFELKQQSSQFVDLQELDWSWPDELKSGKYFLRIRLLIEDDNLENNISSQNDQKQITFNRKENPFFFQVVVEKEDLSPSGGTLELDIKTTPQQNWALTSLASWINLGTVSGSGSQKVIIFIDKNPSNSSRNGQIIAQTSEQTLELSFYQPGSATIDQIVLSRGWNLISIDVDPVDPAIEKIVKSLKSNNLVQINALDKGKYLSYDPTKPSSKNTLKLLVAGTGFWIKVKEEDVLKIEGTPALDAGPPSELPPGRNLIGYIPKEPQLPQDYFKNLIDNQQLKYVIAYKNGQSIRFDPLAPQNSSLKRIENGYGYWVEIDTKASLKVMPIDENEAILADQHTSFNRDLWLTKDVEILQIPSEKNFNVNIKKGQQGTLLLMITDLNGRILKTQQVQLSGHSSYSSLVNYSQFIENTLVMSVLINGQFLGSRVYLND